MRVARAEARGAAAALAFLTRVPVGRRVELDAADVSRGAALFPLVGAGVGAVVGGVTAGLSGTLTAPLAAVVGLAAGAVLTGALHLDGLADAADALGGATRERALEIMRDHTIGTYGAAALLLDLAAKTGALAVLAGRHDVLRFAVCAACACRLVPIALSSLPYARPGGGLGRALVAAGPGRGAVAAGTAALVCLVLAGWDGAVLLGVVGAVGLAAASLAYRWLGGVTGDVLGASAELAEVGALLAAVALTA